MIGFIWIVLALCVVGGIVMVGAAWLRRRRGADLGTISDQWIAEQRLGRGTDSQR